MPCNHEINDWNKVDSEIQSAFSYLWMLKFPKLWVQSLSMYLLHVNVSVSMHSLAHAWAVLSARFSTIFLSFFTVKKNKKLLLQIAPIFHKLPFTTTNISLLQNTGSLLFLCPMSTGASFEVGKWAPSHMSYTPILVTVNNFSV